MNKTYSLILLYLFAFNAHAELIKVSDSGVQLDNSASTWSCVIDDKTGLMWEVKTRQKGLQNTDNTFTWFDGNSGVENGDYSRNCHWSEQCNTQNYISALNETTLCQADNWRLPKVAELNSLLVYNDDNPLINQAFFPNTQAKSYWSSTTHPTQSSVALDVAFFYGGTNGSDKSFDSYIRGVSDVK